MGYYRFLDSQWIDGMLGGNLRIGNARYYRLLEIATDDEWIGDREESQAIAKTGPVSITPENRDPGTLQMLENNNLAQVAPGATLHFVQGATIIHSTECYILSLCSDEIDQLKPIMTDPERVRFAYNGCIELLDPQYLCRHIENYGTVNGRPFREVFSHIKCDTVRYTGQATDPWSGRIQADPFLKSPKYKSQSEYRLVFHPCAQNMTDDHININFPNADFLLHEVFRNDGPAQTAMPEDPRTNSQLIGILGEAQSRIEQQRQSSSASDHRTIDREAAWEEDRRRQSEFEKTVKQDFLENVVKAYWVLRCRGYRSLEMDRALDPFTGAWSFYNALSEYLYGPNHTFRDNEIMRSSLTRNGHTDWGIYDRLINDHSTRLNRTP